MSQFEPRKDVDDAGANSVAGLKLILRCDAGEAIGLGHVKRCIALAQWLIEKPIFALSESHPAARAEIQAAGFESIAAGGDEDLLRSALDADVDAIVCDIAHIRSRNQRANMRAHVLSLVALGLPVALIDGVDADALIDDELASKVALCVRPYPGMVAGASGRWLTGLEYFIVSPEAARVAQRSRMFADKVQSILVTTGGSDVGALGPRILQELNAIDEVRYQIRVIVGPMVPANVREATHSAASASRHDVKVVEGRSDLTDDMRWCDLAVATTGLTKYELALNAVPSILISPDQYHQMNNGSFRACGTALDLGVAEELSSGAIADAVRRVSGDRALREQLGGRGRHLVDGLGAIRLLSAIGELADAR